MGLFDDGQGLFSECVRKAEDSPVPDAARDTVPGKHRSNDAIDAGEANV